MSQMPKSFPTRLIMAAAGLAALAACARSEPPEGPTPTSLAKADPAISSLQPTAKGVRLTLRVVEPDVAGDTIRITARAARQIARAVQAGVRDLPATATVITVDLYGTDVDKFGKRSFGRMLETDFDVASLRALDLKAVGPAGVLGTAIDLRLDPSGEAGVAAWCMRYPHVGGDWCAMAGD
jgi:hypothetical protein